MAKAKKNIQPGVDHETIQSKFGEGRVDVANLVELFKHPALSETGLVQMGLAAATGQ